MIRSRDDLVLYVKADLASYGLNRWRARYRLSRRTVYFQWLLRRSEYYSNCRRDPAGRLFGKVLAVRVRLLGERLGFSIPRNVFGPGLSIAHKGTIVVNKGARVGRNCRLHHGVTIGHVEGRNPIIGDNVWIAPGVCVIGGIVVGDGVAIGANAVVNRDVEAGVTVAGVPAQVISGKGSRRLVIDGCAVAGLADDRDRPAAACPRNAHTPMPEEQTEIA